MDVFPKLPTVLQHKILLHLKNPECHYLMKYWRAQIASKRENLLVSLNRYNYFRFHRKKYWDDYKDDDGTSILFNFHQENDEYLQLLKLGIWKPCDEREHGILLRTALFNILEKTFWCYHGDCAFPWTLKNTIYDSLEDKRTVEQAFQVTIPGDKGLPPYSYEEWCNRGSESGNSLFMHRRKVRAPRDASGKWDHKTALKKIIQMQATVTKRLISRKWDRWNNKKYKNTVFPYFELNYTT